MKKILLFIMLMISAASFGQQILSVDTIYAKKVEIDGNTVPSVPASDAALIAKLDTVIGETFYGYDETSQQSQLLGGDVKLACPLFNSYSSAASISITDAQGRGVMFAPTKNITIYGVRFWIKDAATGATYDNFNGAVITYSNGDTLATGATDGTFWNSAGITDVDFSHPVELVTDSVYNVSIHHNNSAISTNPTVYRVFNDLNWLGVGNFGLAATSITSVGENVTYSTSSNAILMVLY